MLKKNSFQYAWPTIFGSFYNNDHLNIKEKLITYFEEYKIKNPDGRRSGENYKLYESNYNLHLQKNETVDYLFKNFFVNCFLQTAKEANKNYLNLIGKSELGVTITDAWFIHYEKGGFVIPHTHEGCSWCCVYYVQIGEDASKRNGGTYFQKPSQSRSTQDFGSYYNKFLHLEAQPEEGKMYIWPNHIMHGSYPYDGDKDRIIISANVKVSIMKDGKPTITL
tara:strand:+ start:205 stop:870 length:666 start_codon:yes stop_codon:yes gene_type:complete